MRNFTAGAVVFAALMLAPTVPNAARADLGPGEVRTILSLPDGDSPEGIAVDAEDGAVYIGNRSPLAGSLQTSQILKLHGDGAVDFQFAALPPSPVDSSGLLGLVTYRGDIFAALQTGVAQTNGVYRISRHGGRIERLAGSADILFPNALTFDSRGLLYVTDSKDGAVWRFDPDNINRPGELWVRHPLLSPDPLNPFGLTEVGANGIAFADGKMFVANTSRNLLAGIELGPDGSAGTPTLVAGGDLLGPLTAIDGIAAAPDGSILGAMPGFEVLAFLTGLPAAPVVRIDPVTGEVTPLVLQDPDNDVFDSPLSLALSVDGSSLFVTNGALLDAQIPPNPGPGVVEIGLSGLFGDAQSTLVPEPTAGVVIFVLASAFALRIPRRGTAMPA